jgi:hypothetical protein
LFYHKLNTPDEKVIIHAIDPKNIQGCKTSGILKVLGEIATNKIASVETYSSHLLRERFFNILSPMPTAKK